MEELLEQLENEKLALTEQLSNGSLSGDEFQTVGERLSAVVTELEAKTDRWLELSEYV